MGLLQTLLLLMHMVHGRLAPHVGERFAIEWQLRCRSLLECQPGLQLVGLFPKCLLSVADAHAAEIDARNMTFGLFGQPEGNRAVASTNVEHGRLFLNPTSLNHLLIAV